MGEAGEVGEGVESEEDGVLYLSSKRVLSISCKYKILLLHILN